MKRMRNLILGFLLFHGSMASSQWIVQQCNLPQGVEVGGFSVVNEQIVWGLGSGATEAGYENITWYCRTLDGGQNWVAGKVGIPDSSFIASFSAVSADSAWIAAGAGSWLPSDMAGVYRTIDGGQTWTHQTEGFSFPLMVPNFVHFFDARHGLYMSDPIDGYFVIYTTEDGGDHWQRVPNSAELAALPDEYGSVSMYCTAGKALIFGCCYGFSGRVFMTTDYGKHWRAGQTMFKTPFNVHVSPAFKDSLEGIVVATAYVDFLGMAATHDGGRTWTQVTSSPVSAGSAVYIPDTDAGYLACSRDAWGTVRMKEPGSAFTLDGGISWTKIDTIGRNAIAFASRWTGWAAGSNQSNIYKWNIGPAAAIGCYPTSAMTFTQTVTGWSSAPAELSITNYGQEPLTLSEIVMPPDFSLTRNFDLPKTLNALETARINVVFVPRSAGTIVDSLILVSNAAASPRHAIRLEGEGFAPALAQARQCYAAASKNLYSIDAATGKASLITPVTIGKSLQNMVINPETGALIGVYSINTGTEFHAVSAVDGKTNLLRTVPVGYMRPIAWKADTLFGATSTGSLYRIDLTAGTAELIGTAPQVKYNALAVHPATGELYASITSASGTQKDRIVKVNTSNGDTTLVGATGDNVMMPALAFSPAGVLYALKSATGTPVITIDLQTGQGTAVGNSGVASLSGLAWAPSTTAIDQYADAAPGVFNLLQNYPNPFNPVTTIRFYLPVREEITLRVCNLLGQEVALLKEGTVSAGPHAVVWDARNQAGGIYYVVLTAGRERQVRKAVLLK